MPRLGKKSLFLLCCAFVLGYHSILDLNISSLSEKGKPLRNLNEGGIIGFIYDVFRPFLAALRRKFQDDDEEIQVEQISSSPTPSDFVVNVTTNSTADARWCWLGRCDASNPENGYLTSDVHCGRFILFILVWHYEKNPIEYKIVYEDNTEFERGNQKELQASILGRLQKSLDEYWVCREREGYYAPFLSNLHKRPFLEAKFVGNDVQVACYDSCTNSAMCWDLTQEKKNDECSFGEDFQDLLQKDSDANVDPKFDYKIDFDVGEEIDNEPKTYEYSVETLKTNPVRRSVYGVWAKKELSLAETNLERENLEALFKNWGLYDKYDEDEYTNYCNDLNKKGRDVKCSNGRVFYLDVGKFGLLENLFIYSNTSFISILYVFLIY